ncbi:hypothetical protein D3C81_1794530 [compost metagenome]
MGIGDDQLQFVFVQQQPMQAWLARWQVADADVQAAIEQAPFDFQPRQFVDLHDEMRLRPAQAFEQLRHQAGPHGLQHADGQGAQGLALEVAHGLMGPLQAIE